MNPAPVSGPLQSAFQLNQPRSLCFAQSRRAGRFTVQLRFRTATSADWLLFLGALVRTGADLDALVKFFLRAQLPALPADVEHFTQASETCRRLISQTLAKVKGGGVGWVDRLSALGQVTIALSLLPQVTTHSSGGQEGAFVELAALWGHSGGPRKSRVATAVTGLRHSVRSPSTEQFAAWRCARELRPGWIAILADLYDELLVGVEGYQGGGQPLSPEAARKEMDLAHKVAVTACMFSLHLKGGSD